MFNFKKRFLSSVVALAMVLSSFSFTAIAETTEITNDMIYADKYGVEISFDEVPAADDYEIEIRDSEGAVVETSDVTADEANMLLNVHFVTPITTGETYTIKINDTYKDFVVNEVLFEDFEDAAFDNYSSVGTGNTSVTNSVTGAKFEASADGVIATEDALFGASSTDRKMIIYGKTARKSLKTHSVEGENGTLAIDDTKYTFSVDVASYKVDNQTAYANHNVWVGGNTPPNDNKKAFKISTSNLKPTFADTTQMEASSTNGNVQGFDISTGTYTDGDAANVAGTFATYAIRTVGDNCSGYVGNAEGMAFTGTTADLTAGDSTKDRFAVSPAITTKALIVADNFTITQCEVTGSLGDAFVTERASFTKEDVYADLYGVQVQFATQPTRSQRENVKVTTLSDEEVEADLSYEPDNMIINATFKTPITTDTYYKIDVDGDVVIFEVNEVLFEDFEDAAFGNYSSVGTDNTSVTNSVTGTKFATSADGVFATEDALFGASSTDRKMVIFGSGKAIRTESVQGANGTLGEEDTKYTFSVDVASYKMNSAVSYGVYNHVWVGGNQATLGKKSFNISSSSTTTKFADSIEVTTPLALGNVEGFDASAGTYDANHEENKEGTPATHVIRTVGDSCSGYVGNADGMEFTGTIADPTAEDSVKDRFGVQSAGKNSILVADNFKITQCEVFDADDDMFITEPADFTKEDVYADLYGVQVQFETPASITQRENVKVTTLSDEEIEADLSYDSDNMIINATFATPITTDTYYKIDVDGEVVIFKVNEVFFEDFENAAFDNYSSVGTGNTSVTNSETGAKFATSADGVFATEDGVFGASSADRKMVIFGGSKALRTDSVKGANGTLGKEDTKYTFSVDVASYKMNSDVSYGAQNYVWIGGNTPALGKKSFNISSSSTTTKFADSIEVTTPLALGNVEGFDASAGTYEPYNEKNVTGTPATHVIRTVGDNCSGYVGKAFTGTIADPTAQDSLKDRIGIQSAGSKSILVADNFRITQCEVFDADDDMFITDPADFTKEDVYADLYGVQIQFETPASITQREGVKITTLSGEEVKADLSYDSDNMIVNATFKTPITADTYYNLDVDGKIVIFKVNEVFFEDFENAAFDNYSSVGTANTSVTNSETGAKFATSADGVFATEAAVFGASSTDRKMVIFGTGKALRTESVQGVNGTLGKEDTKYTFSVDVASYKMNGAVSYGVYNHVWVGGNQAALGKKSFNISSSSTTTKFADSIEVTTPLVLGNVQGFDTATGAYSDEDAANAVGTPATHVIRTVGDNCSGYVGKAFTGTIADPTTEDSVKDRFGVSSAGSKSILVADNFRITQCEVADLVDDAELISVYADVYGVDVVFETPASVQQKVEAKVQTARLKDVQTTTKYNDALNTLSINFNEPIKTDVDYILSVGDVQKKFKVNKLFEEDFEEISRADGEPWSLEDTSSISLKTLNGKLRTLENCFITADTRFGAALGNQKLAIYGSSTHVGGAYVRDIPKNSTISAKVDSFGTWDLSNIFKGDIAVGDDSALSTTISGSVTDTAISFGSQQNSVMDATARVSKSVVDARGTITDGVSVDPETGEETPIAIGWPELTQTAVITQPAYHPNMVLRTYGTTDAVANRVSGFVANGNNTPEFVGTVDVSNTVCAGLTGDLTNAGFSAWGTKTLMTVDDILVTSCTVEDYVNAGPQMISVIDTTVKKDAIYVEFDADVFEDDDDFSGIELLKNGSKDNYRIEVTGKIAKITPEDGSVKSGARYTIVVPKGFAPSPFAQTSDEYSKTFMLTIYADEDFEGNQTSSTGLAVSDNAMYDNERLVLRNGTLSVPAVADADDYIVEFDAQIYTAAIDKAWEEMYAGDGTITADYYAAVPSINMWYNADATGNGGYNWFIQNDSVSTQFVDANGTVEELAKANTTPLAFGDAFNDQYGYDTMEIGIKNGLNFFDSYTGIGNIWVWADVEPKDISRPAPSVYPVKVEKTGKAAKYYVNNALTSQFVGSEKDSAASDGIFGITVSDDEYVVIDNVFVYSYQEFEDIALSLDGTTVSVENISGADKPVVIVVAAYGDDGTMLDAWVAPIITLKAGQNYTKAAELNVASAAKYKAFVWNSMTSLTPYCIPAISQ